MVCRVDKALRLRLTRTFLLQMDCLRSTILIKLYPVVRDVHRVRIGASSLLENKLHVVVRTVMMEALRKDR